MEQKLHDTLAPLLLLLGKSPFLLVLKEAFLKTVDYMPIGLRFQDGLFVFQEFRFGACKTNHCKVIYYLTDFVRNIF